VNRGGREKPRRSVSGRRGRGAEAGTDCGRDDSGWHDYMSVGQQAGGGETAAW
jgi:hypothetical protein